MKIIFVINRKSVASPLYYFIYRNLYLGRAIFLFTGVRKPFCLGGGDFFYRTFDLLTISILLTNLQTICNRYTDKNFLPTKLAKVGGVAPPIPPRLGMTCFYCCLDCFYYYYSVSTFCTFCCNVAERSVFSSVHVISFARVFTKQRNVLRFATIRLKWKTDFNGLVIFERKVLTKFLLTFSN